MRPEECWSSAPKACEVLGISPYKNNPNRMKALISILILIVHDLSKNVFSLSQVDRIGKYPGAPLTLDLEKNLYTIDSWVCSRYRKR
jgi:hypothetical protein